MHRRWRPLLTLVIAAAGCTGQGGYPDDVVSDFLTQCAAQGAGEDFCQCGITKIQKQVPLAEFRDMEQRVLTGGDMLPQVRRIREECSGGAADAGEEVREEEARGALHQALETLAKRPAISYSSSARTAGSPRVDDPTFTRAAKRFEVTATHTGLVYGTGDTQRSAVRLMVVDDHVYLSADAAGWEDLGLPADQAADLAESWNVVDAKDLGFDPQATLTPSEAAETLRSATDDTGSVRAVKPPNGDEVYRFTTDFGTVDVTATEPHRILHTTVPLTLQEPTAADGWAFGVDTETTMHETSVEEFRKFLDALKRALDNVKESHVVVPTMQLSEAGATFVCNVGVCTYTTQVTNTIEAKYQIATEVQVTMKTTLNGGVLGTRTCSAQLTMQPNTTGPLSCSGSFVMPPAPPNSPARQYPIQAQATLSGKAVFVPDMPAIWSKIEKDARDIMKVLEQTN